MTSKEFSDYPSQEGENVGRRRATFSPIQEADEGPIVSGETTSYPSHYDKKFTSVNRDRQSSPKHLPHPHSPSSSSSGHSSPRSPPSQPPPPLSSTAGKQQRPPHPAPSHTPRSKSHDILHGYHGDPNKVGSNWKSSPSMQRGHTRASSDPKRQELLVSLTSPADRGVPSGPGSPQVYRHQQELLLGDHALSRPHRFSPEAETGERRDIRGDSKPPPPPPRNADTALLGYPGQQGQSAASGVKVGGAPGKSSLASVSYDSPARPVGMAPSVGVAAAGEGVGDWKEAIPMNHVALRVAQFSAAVEREEGGGGGGGRERATEKTTLSPVTSVRSPELEKAKVVTLSPGSSEEELGSINSEGQAEETEEADGGYLHHQGEGMVPPGVGFDGGHAHPQLSQPTYLSRAHPSSLQAPLTQSHPASYSSLSQPHPSMSQPHPSLSYEMSGHYRGPGEHSPASRPSHPHHKHHSHQGHHRTAPAPTNPHPLMTHDYHQRSHDHHTTGYPGSHDHHMTSHPGSHDHHMSPHHDHHITSQQRSSYHRQSGPAHFQPGHAHLQPGPAHQRLHISKQSLIKAHEAAASGNLTALRHMLVNHEIDTLCMDDTGLTLAHTAAMTNNLSIIALLVNEGGLPLHALQLPDENLVSPAMVAIQNGYLEVLQWLVDEGKVPLVVQDAGGETLLHHAAHHGSVNCLQWLLKVAKPQNQDELVEFLDNFGVTPAHFAAQQGHLECLQLMIDHNYSVVTQDKESQKPIDWADAMGQTLCVRYLFMHETCWALSADVAHLSKQLDLLQKENTVLREKLSSQEQEYQQALGKIQTHHEERIVKMREQYVDLTASLLKVKETGGGGAGGGASPKVKTQQQANRKDSSRRNKPPLPPESLKRREGESKTEGVDGGSGGGGVGFYRTTTPQEVLEKQKNTLTLRMNASRKAREGRNTLVSRAFSPVQYRLNSRQEREGKTAIRSQRHNDQNRPQLKVKFSEVNQYIDHSHYGDASGHSHHDNRSHEHVDQETISRKGQSPSHKASSLLATGGGGGGGEYSIRQHTEEGTSHLRDN